MEHLTILVGLAFGLAAADPSYHHGGGYGGHSHVSVHQPYASYSYSVHHPHHHHHHGYGKRSADSGSAARNATTEDGNTSGKEFAPRMDRAEGENEGYNVAVPAEQVYTLTFSHPIGKRSPEPQLGGYHNHHRRSGYGHHHHRPALAYHPYGGVSYTQRSPQGLHHRYRRAAEPSGYRHHQQQHPGHGLAGGYHHRAVHPRRSSYHHHSPALAHHPYGGHSFTSRGPQGGRFLYRRSAEPKPSYHPHPVDDRQPRYYTYSSPAITYPPSGGKSFTERSPLGLRRKRFAPVLDESEFGEFAGEFTGEFAGESAGEFAGEFASDSAGEFAGEFNGEFAGESAGEFVGESAGEFNGEFAGEFEEFGDY